MQQTVKTTVRVKLHTLTNRKADLLAREYEAFQTEVHGGDADLYLERLVLTGEQVGFPVGQRVEFDPHRG